MAILPQNIRHEGVKRAGGSESRELVVKVGQAGQAVTEFAGTRSNTGNRTNAGEPKVLWNAVKRARNISSPGGGGGSGGTDESSGRAKKNGGGGSILASLAKSFKERHGEDLSLDDDDMEADGEGGDSTVPRTSTKRARSRSSGGSATEVAAATAKTMSPAKLAAEVQRARARAREERFGGASKSGPATAVAAGGRRPPSPGKVTVGGTAAAEMSYARARTETRPLDSAAADMRELTAITASGGAGDSTGSQSRTASRALKSMETGRVSTIIGANDRGAATSITESEAAGSGTVDRTAAANDFRCTLEASPSTTSAAVPSVSASLPVVSAAPTATAIPPNTPPSTQQVSAAASAPKTSSVAIEGSKKSSSATAGALDVVQAPAANQSLHTQQHPTSGKETATLSKVHTIRLRSRTDTLWKTNPQPNCALDGGVEESKNFDPPNPSPDSGVEECKGFDPPNVSNSPCPSATSARGSGATFPVGSLQAVPPAFTQGSTTAPVNAPAAPSCPVVSSCGTQSSSALPRSGLWGPSFGIVPAGAAAFLATQSGSGSRSGASNPWILSPDAPTFAKNLGRPLARFSSQSMTKPSGTTSGGIAYPMSASSKGRDRSTNVSASADGPSDSTGRAQAAGGASTGNPDRASLSRNGAFSAKSSSARTPPRDTAVNEQTEAETSQERGLGASDAEDENDREPPSHQVLAEHPTGSGGNISDTSIVGTTGVTDRGGEEDARAASDADDALLGVRVSRSAKDLLERLKRERQESLNFERKLTQALLDL